MKNTNTKETRILIVDDNPKNLQVLGNILKQSGYKLEFATNGKQAIDWINDKSFDIILLDIMMPEMDGFEVCQKIREDNKHADIPIIFLTAKTDKESTVKGFMTGGQDYITKPFDSHELLARVETHLELKYSKEKLSNVNKWLEQQVLQKTKELQSAYEELEVLDKAKIEFLKILSHELRTPLNGIKGFTQILKQKIQSQDLLHYINVIEFSSDRLENFSNIALLISSLRTKSYLLKFQEIKLSSVLEEICKNFKQHLEEKSLKLNLNNNFKNDIIIADLELTKECFRQVIENAIGYSEENGSIQISISGDEERITVLLKDSGPGFFRRST